MLWLSKFLGFFGLIFLIFSSSSSSSSSSDRSQCRPENLNTSFDCRVWPHIECDAKTGHVTHLHNFPLNGTITSKSSLFSLLHLQSLTIVGKGLEIEIGIDAFNALTRNLTSLEQLTLVGVNMSSVPPSSLINLSSSLTSLTIRSCQLTGKLPETSSHFPKLVYLDLSKNNLRGHLPSMCSNCIFLSLSSNSFSGPVPSWIYSLGNLETLSLEDNLFSGEIGEFRTRSLSMLCLNNNSLHGVVPRSLFRQMELKCLGLSSNRLSGVVDLQEFSKLKHLSGLDLSDNELSVTYTNCTFEIMLYLRLSSCNLTEFPHFLRSSNELKVLDLSNNHIQGVVPKWLKEMKRLEILDLRSNLFFGPLPIFSPLLNYFLASKNRFSGEIPSSICNITVLDLSYNNLSGGIPPFIGNVESLSVLDLRSNKLHGEIPESLFVKESSLRSLNLNGNRLQGQVPRSLVYCSKLEVLDLGNNRFNDTFLDWFESLPYLQVLVLRGNAFHGSIGNPSPGFPFQNLRIMDLSHNHFTGSLPTKYFGDFKAMPFDTEKVEMKYMGGSYYQDSVTLTMKGFDFELVRILNIYKAIDFSSNYVTGKIPESVGQLESLKGLNLSHNMLTGILPPSLGNMINLEWLDLSSNELVGKIPVELADIPWLSFFNVSRNHLEGPIPRGSQFNTFRNESFEGNSNLCGFPLPKSCGGDTKPPEPSLEQEDEDEDDDDLSNIRNGFDWRFVMMGYASGLVIGISIGYMLLYSNAKLPLISEIILDEIEYRKVPKKRNARRSQRT